MGERVDKINKAIKDFEEKKENIANEYSEASIKEEIKNVDETLNSINSTLNIKKLHIKKLENELEGISPNEKDLIEEYQKQIKEANNDPELLKMSFEMQKCLEKKTKLSTQLLKDKKDNEKIIKEETREAENKLRANLTQEGMQLDKDITKTELNMKLTLADMNDFKYEYEEKDGVKTPINGDKFKEINEKYENLKGDLTELKEAKKICEDKLKEFKDRDDKEAAEFSKTWNETKENRSNETISTPENESPEEKSENVEPIETVLEEESAEEKAENAEPTEPTPENEQEKGKAENTEPIIQKPKELEWKNDGYVEYENHYGLGIRPLAQKIDLEDKNTIKLIKINAETKKANVFYGPTAEKDSIDTKETKQLDIEDIIENRKEIYRSSMFKAVMYENGVSSHIKQAIFKRKMNPVILKALEENTELMDSYVKSVIDKRAFPFEYAIDLEESELSKKDFRFMNRIALKEAKIEGNEVIGTKEKFYKLKNFFKNIKDKTGKLGKKKEAKQIDDGKNKRNKIDKKPNGFKDNLQDQYKKLEEQRKADMQNAYEKLTDEQKANLPNLSVSDIQKLGVPYNAAYSLYEEYGNKEQDAPEKGSQNDVETEYENEEK